MVARIILHYLFIKYLAFLFLVSFGKMFTPILQNGVLKQGFRASSVKNILRAEINRSRWAGHAQKFLIHENIYSKIYHRKTEFTFVAG